MNLISPHSSFLLISSHFSFFLISPHFSAFLLISPPFFSFLLISPHFSSVSGHLEVVKLLVASGAEVDCKDKKAYTPLHAAASSGMSSTVHYLLSLGVNVSAHKCVHEQRPGASSMSPHR